MSQQVEVNPSPIILPIPDLLSGICYLGSRSVREAGDYRIHMEFKKEAYK